MTSSPTPEEVTVRLHRAMDAAAGLTPADVSNVQTLIEAGEWLLAFDTLCTQIYEWEISLDPGVIRDLETLGAALGASKLLTSNLWDDIADG